MRPTRQEILEHILRTIESLCHDWEYAQDLGPGSLLFTELGLESLDAVILGTSIQEHYHKQMPFAELLVRLGQERRDLSIGELVDFVDTHLGAPEIETVSTRLAQ